MGYVVQDEYTYDSWVCLLYKSLFQKRPTNWVCSTEWSHVWLMRHSNETYKWDYILQKRPINGVCSTEWAHVWLMKHSNKTYKRDCILQKRPIIGFCSTEWVHVWLMRYSNETYKRDYILQKRPINGVCSTGWVHEWLMRHTCTAYCIRRVVSFIGLFYKGDLWVGYEVQNEYTCDSWGIFVLLHWEGRLIYRSLFKKRPINGVCSTEWVHVWLMSHVCTASCIWSVV